MVQVCDGWWTGTVVYDGSWYMSVLGAWCKGTVVYDSKCLWTGGRGWKGWCYTLVGTGAVMDVVWDREGAAAGVGREAGEVRAPVTQSRPRCGHNRPAWCVAVGRGSRSSQKGPCTIG